MANIHITLVGGQTTPVYQGIIATNPDRVILIYSERTENEANRIRAEIDVDCELKKFDPVDLNKINAAIHKMTNAFCHDDVITINVSSGTKPWSLLFYENFKDVINASVVVIDQNNMLWNMKTYQCTVAEFDMDVQFRLYGNPLRKYVDFGAYSDDDKLVCSEIRSLRVINKKDFYNLTKQLYENADLDYVSSRRGSYIRRDRSKNIYYCNIIGESTSMNKTLSSPRIDSLILNTGWFELEIAMLLSAWSKAKDIRLNCIFPSKKGASKNEIDIIVNTGTKLLFVEIKTSIFDNTTIDKFASAVKVYGGLGSKAIFITDAPMKDKALEKCHDHGIMHYSLQNKPEDKSHEEMLFEMLDKELNNLNVK